MSLIKGTVAAGVERSRAIDGDHIHVVDAPSETVSIIVTLLSGQRRSYVIEKGAGVKTGAFKHVSYMADTAGVVKIQATIGQYIPATNEVLAKIDPNNNGVAIDGEVNVTIDEIGIDPAKNTVKIDPLNNAVDISGQTVDISNQVVNVAGQTVDISNQVVDVTGQTVDISNQVVDVSGQTVDISGQTVDISDQEIKVKASTAISSPNKSIGVSGELFAAEPSGQKVLYIPINGKIWVGPVGVSKSDGYPVGEGEPMEWHTKAALHAVSDSGSAVDVRVLKEVF